MSEPSWVALGTQGGVMDWEGQWLPGQSYVPGDVVRFNGIDYVAVNPSTGQQPPASTMVGTGPAVRVRRSVGTTVATGTSVAIPFDLEDFDTDGMHDPAVNPTRLTVKAAGIYMVTANVQLESLSAAGTYRVLYFRTNGLYDIADFGAHPHTVNRIALAVIHGPFAVGDYVEAVMFQDQGGNANVAAVNYFSPTFAMARIA